MAVVINGTTGVSGVDGSAGTPAVQGTDTNTGIFYPAADTIAFAEGGVESMRIDSGGRLLVGLTSANTSGSNFQVSQGITFPATQSASSDANTLDDYEEGTFTPSLVPGTSGSITLTAAAAKYTKVGRAVTVTGICEVASVSSPVGTLLLQGLPFTNSADTSSRSSAAIYVTGLAITATTSIMGRIITSESQIRIEKFAAGSTSAMAGDVVANTLFQFSLTYFV